MFLVLNSEWQACKSPELEHGARMVARELFGDAPHLDLGPSGCDPLDVRDGVFALDCIAARFERTLGELELARPRRIFNVGGTCGSEAAPIACLAARHEHLGVVWLDAHGDLNTPASSPSGHFNGMVLRTLLGDGPAAFTDRLLRPLDASHVVVVGVRDLDPDERDYVASAGVGLIEGWPDDVGVRVVDALRRAGVRRIYIHIDADVFDPASYRDACYSVPGGPSLDTASSAVRTIVDSFEVVGVGVVESCGRDPRAPRALKEFLVSSGLWPAG